MQTTTKRKQHKHQHQVRNASCTNLYHGKVPSIKKITNLNCRSSSTQRTESNSPQQWKLRLKTINSPKLKNNISTTSH